jgi:VIT1/CCC1 family predicted Fe2+/Mn2+ transporter
MEVEESVEILTEQGMQKDHAWQIIDIMRQYPDLRVKRMMDNELCMSDIRDDKPIIQWMITLFSFVIFWAVPLVPYIFGGEHINLWMTSIIMTWLSLVLLGIVRRSITRISFVGTVSQIVVLWAIAAAVAYWTGHIVMNLQG